MLLALPATLTDELMSSALAGNRRGVQAMLDDSIRGALAELANTQIEADEDDELSEGSADDADL